MEYGLYIHIPYCASRCRYCDFYSQPGSRQVPEAYIDAIVRDFMRYAPKDGDGGVRRPATVYFGGGTPGLLTPDQTQRVLQAARPAAGAEITLEANPEGATAQKLAGWREAGVNRLSLGVQTARGESLKALGRLHTVQSARDALREARGAGFKNISGDVMLALPAYSTAEFDETLALLQTGGATHISAYLLKVEAGTAFAANPPKGLPDEDEAADFYLYAVRRLGGAGYPQYEISNFARAGFEGRHNLIYWNAGNWLGLGPAAHSCFLGRRFCFAADVNAFLQDRLPPAPQPDITAQDYMMLRLRLARGLGEAAFFKRFGVRLTPGQAALLKRLCAAGLALKTPGGWALTPRGMLVQNAVLGRLFDAEEV